MKTTTLCLTANELNLIFQSCSPDAAYLYLYIRSGNALDTASIETTMGTERVQKALAELKQAGLYRISMPEKPHYDERDIVDTAEKSALFRQLTQEIEMKLGRILRTEDLRILLNISNYLGLPHDVILLLVDHCISITAMTTNIGKMPSMYAIEKEAYRWSDAEIFTLEEAQRYIQQKNQKHGGIASICRLLQIHGRQLTSPEEAYAKQWLQIGYSDEMIRHAYEKSCMATGGRNWEYMDKVLASIRKKTSQALKGAPCQYDADSGEAIQKMMSMETDEFLGISTRSVAERR